MECNRDEANRAKEIAEKKFATKDMAGAKKFALKAQSLYPGLEGIPQMLATLDVYISAENKINGEADWYGILGVNPTADDETVRKAYRKLALMLHPDKNKSMGADGAFKLISEAWSLLSDKIKRAAYDQKRNFRAIPKASTMPGNSSASPGTNGFHNFTKRTTPSTKPAKVTERASHSSHQPKPNTFWTVCHRCKMQYEYLRVYLNHNLLCPNCQQPFFAIEIAPPATNGSKSSSAWNFSRQPQATNHQATNREAANSARNNTASSGFGVGGPTSHEAYNQTSFQWVPFSRPGGASTAAQAASVVQQAYEKVKREREEAQAATKREEALRRKQASKKGSGMPSTVNQVGSERGGAGVTDSTTYKQNVQTYRVNGFARLNATRELSILELQNMLMHKARIEICKKLDEWKSANDAKISGKEERGRSRKENTSGESLLDGNTGYGNKLKESLHRNNEAQATNPAPGTAAGEMDSETLESLSMNVPDPDFHDFDLDRSEKSFGENQVWAAYDDDDGMPRYYALVHDVISRDPFGMRISWLNSKTNSELGPLNWVASGFSKTCGDFRIGKHEINKSLNSFSHKVRWTKGMRGVVSIYPLKGDVWALYRNWSSDWNELTADEVIHKYDMVEVLEDYDEVQGVTVAPLVKVAGFKTIFHRHLNPKEVRTIPREELFRFSHQVPSYLLSGQEAPNAPKGCRELDPAATPLDLLQVIIDAKDDETMEIEKAFLKENAVHQKTARTEKILESEKKAQKEMNGISENIPQLEILENI